MKATFQDKLLHGFIGMNAAGITHLYLPGIGISKHIDDRFTAIITSTSLSENIASFKKIFLFYTCITSLSSSKFQVGTLSINYNGYTVSSISDSRKQFINHGQRIAMKTPFFQSSFIKGHVLEVP
jgi:hypothetical protein